MKKKTVIFNIIFVALFGVFLVTDQFIHYQNGCTGDGSVCYAIVSVI